MSACRCVASLQTPQCAGIPRRLILQQLHLHHYSNSLIQSQQQCSSDRRSSPCSSTASSSSTSGYRSSRLERDSGDYTRVSKRGVLIGAALLAVGAQQQLPAWAVMAVEPARIQLQLAPDQSKYDPTDPELREAAAMLQSALNAEDVVKEEALWTQVIDRFGGLKDDWVPDVVGRAWGNRGNARSRQGKLEAALGDYAEAMRLCPWSVDPVLNRGVALEAMERFEEAGADYRAVLEANPSDPSAWNNLGNTNAGMGRWDLALDCFSKAASLAPNFSFAAGNRALALYQTGKQDLAMREMRTLLRRYPDFDDMRAALAAALWASGREDEAEGQWLRVDDPRYKDRVWLRQRRRWPPALRGSLEALLDVRSLPSGASA